MNGSFGGAGDDTPVSEEVVMSLHTCDFQQRISSHKQTFKFHKKKMLSNFRNQAFNQTSRSRRISWRAMNGLEVFKFLNVKKVDMYVPHINRKK